MVFRSDAASAAAARRFLKKALADAPEEVRERAGLVVSELVANVVRHTDCDVFTLDLHGDAHGVRVEVHDDNPEAVVARHAAPDAEGGRGLQIVSGLSSRWGVSRQKGDGKSVWFRLETS